MEERYRISSSGAGGFMYAILFQRYGSGYSLMEEIVKTEGAASPVLRGELLLPPSQPHQFSPIRAWRRSSSLPDLTRGDMSSGGLLQPPPNIFVPGCVRFVCYTTVFSLTGFL